MQNLAPTSLTLGFLLTVIAVPRSGEQQKSKRVYMSYVSRGREKQLLDLSMSHLERNCFSEPEAEDKRDSFPGKVPAPLHYSVYTKIGRIHFRRFIFGCGINLVSRPHAEISLTIVICFSYRHLRCSTILSIK